MLTTIRHIFRQQKGGMLLDATLACLVIGALALVAMVNVGDVKQDAYETIAESWIASFNAATRIYKRDTGAYPTTLDVLAVETAGKGPWMNTVPAADPWGTPYQYDNATGIVFSAGRDRTPGTSDDIRLR